MNDLGFFDDLNGYAIAHDKNNHDHYLYRTQDGGQSWQPFGRYNKDRYFDNQYARYIKRVMRTDGQLFVGAARIMKIEE